MGSEPSVAALRTRPTVAEPQTESPMLVTGKRGLPYKCPSRLAPKSRSKPDGWGCPHSASTVSATRLVGVWRMRGSRLGDTRHRRAQDFRDGEAILEEA